MPITSWWRFGEGGGAIGPTLALWSIECAFCGERGNFERSFHAEKKKPNSDKKLNFDVYKCNNCAGYVHVFWSASEGAFLDRGTHAFRVLPWPLNPKPQPSSNLSEEMARFWIQAHQSVSAEAWDAASVMARSVLQLALREQNAAGKRLVDQIQDLGMKGLLAPSVCEWATEVRLLGNDAAHPVPGEPPAEPQDVHQCIDFLDFLLYCLYDLPAEVKAYRARRSTNGT
jgi:hypothetical protein